MAWYTKVTDNCTRANENPLSDGGKWSSFGSMGPLQLLSNAVAKTTADANHDGAYRSGDTFGNDQFIEITIGGTLNGYFAVGVRCSNDDGYFAQWDRGGGGGYAVAMLKYTNGVQSSLGSFTSVTDAPDVTIRMEAEGDQIRAYADGTLIATVTDASFASGSLGMFKYSGDTVFTNVVMGDTIPPVSPVPPGTASNTLYPDLSGKALHVEARRQAPGDPTVLEYWNFLTGAYVATLVDACKAPMDEAVLDATKSIYSRTTDTWPAEGFYGVYDTSDNLVSDPVLIGAVLGSGATAAEVVSAVENSLLGERNWNKAAATETVKRVDGTTAKVFDLTVDVAGDVVAKVPRP